MLGYLELVRAHRRFLAFGLVLACFSSFGQTFFIALFNDGIRAEFALSHGEYGRVYSVATLASGLSLLWLGRTIDHVDLRVYAAAVCTGLVVACFAMSGASAMVTLGLAIFLLRLSGQGLLSHTAMTTMARYFDSTRGKAMSIAALGFPAGEAVLPLVAVVLIAEVGWRQSWSLIGLALGVSTVPLALLLLRGHTERHRDHLSHLERQSAAAHGDGGRRQWTRRDVLRDVRFFLLLPAVLAPGFIVTGLFFHQLHLVATKGWSAAWFASCFAGFAAAQLPSSLLAGPLVDRVGARRLLPFVLGPLALGLTALAALDAAGAALIFLVLTGITAGLSGPIVGAVWAELYGVRHLGAIRALVTALGVVSTAVSPVAMGELIDRGVSMEALSWAFLVGVVIATGLAAVGLRVRRAPSPDSARELDG